ncbi:MAG: hypothetical protein J3K34DRAFT_437108 [Monoraphidium minutum]|nr:MAG: hypothetical protein J3K34DRAFT_437108 [Monoraphidium minutum]
MGPRRGPGRAHDDRSRDHMAAAVGAAVGRRLLAHPEVARARCSRASPPEHGRARAPVGAAAARLALLLLHLRRRHVALLHTHVGRDREAARRVHRIPQHHTHAGQLFLHAHGQGAEELGHCRRLCDARAALVPWDGPDLVRPEHRPRTLRRPGPRPRHDLQGAAGGAAAPRRGRVPVCAVDRARGAAAGAGAERDGRGARGASRGRPGGHCVRDGGDSARAARPAARGQARQRHCCDSGRRRLHWLAPGARARG